MMLLLFLASLLNTTADDRLRALFEEGATYGQFLERASRRVDLWNANTESGVVGDSLLARAQAAGGPFYLLAVAVDGCSDSVSTIPFLADLAQAVDGLDLRIISSQLGFGVMDRHRTPDGRAATPTVLLLNAEFDEVGAFIERPAPLQDWALGEGAELDDGEFYRRKMAWYAEDNGRTTIAQIVELMEAASGGK